MNPSVVVMIDSNAQRSYTQRKSKPPQISLLEQSGYSARQVEFPHKEFTITKSDIAIVLIAPLSQLSLCHEQLNKWNELPLFWWSVDAVQETLQLQGSGDNATPPMDGLLTSSMTTLELRTALQFGIRNHLERRRLMEEKNQLAERLNDRKWVEIAKGILSNLKGISEEEAYDLLRKQAMNERKRIVDVATSVINVYQLLQEQRTGGASYAAGVTEGSRKRTTRS